MGEYKLSASLEGHEDDVSYKSLKAVVIALLDILSNSLHRSEE